MTETTIETTLTKEQVMEYFTTDEGKSLLEEQKKPLLQKRDEIFDTMNSMKSELQSYKEKESASEQAAREAEEERLKGSQDLDALKAFYDTELQQSKAAVTELTQKVASKERDRIIAETASKHSNSPKPLQLLLRDRITVAMEGGETTTTVLDEGGEPMYFEGKPATIDHVIDELKSNETYAPFFSGTGDRAG